MAWWGDSSPEKISDLLPHRARVGIHREVPALGNRRQPHAAGLDVRQVGQPGALLAVHEQLRAGQPRNLPIRSALSASSTIDWKIPRTAPARTLWRRLAEYSALAKLDRLMRVRAAKAWWLGKATIKRSSRNGSD